MVDHKQAAEKCNWPVALDDLSLIAAIDGEAGPDVLAHLRDCPYCAERARVFEEMQQLLRKQLFRMFCPSSDELAAYQQGTLTGGQHAFITEHLKECPHCTRELKLLEQLSREDLPARSPPVTRDKDQHHTSQQGALRRIAAELLDIRSASLFAGAYGALRGPSHASQYAYHAENLQLTIGVQRVVSRTDRRVVHGSLELDDDLYEVFSGATANLLRDDILIRTAELDELGNFVLDDLAPGTYQLALHLPDREVIVEALSL
ncbi:MAG TPA: zf-HC2 domain-containing protein [Roseiflexaceae bacterium]|nr:zf-HC2 domain-containing protein [Roseiflexaceae bacterium]